MKGEQHDNVKTVLGCVDVWLGRWVNHQNMFSYLEECNAGNAAKRKRNQAEDSESSP